jgi:hypothetical protein
MKLSTIAIILTTLILYAGLFALGFWNEQASAPPPETAVLADANTLFRDAASRAWERKQKRWSYDWLHDMQFSPKITTGMRAIWLPVDAGTWSVVEFQDRVDVAILRYPPADGSKGDDGEDIPLSAFHGLQDMKVLDKRQTASGEYAVLFEVYYHEAHLIAIAKAAAASHPDNPPPAAVFLRNPQDDGYLANSREYRLEDLGHPALRQDYFERGRNRRVEIYSQRRSRR